MSGPAPLAEAVLATHLVVIGFNLFGLVAIPLGGWLEWRFVRVLWWRLLHVLSLAIVAAQALAGRACFLTLWQDRLSGSGVGEPPLIVRWVNRLVYWPAPMWVFTVLYAALFLYVLALFWLVPTRRSGEQRKLRPKPDRRRLAP